MSDKEKLITLKKKLAELLSDIAWLMPEDEFYKTFPDTLKFLGGLFE